MKTINKKILIIDEAGFSRICSAILEKEGYGTSAIHDIDQCESQLTNEDIGLIITSYPYGALLLEKVKAMKIPIIVLSDHMSGDLMTKLDNFDKSLSHCMIKPLDYHKFRSLVNQAMNTSQIMQ